MSFEAEAEISDNSGVVVRHSNKLTYKSPKEARTIHIWEDAESRIQFLETVLKDKDWMAVVHTSPMQQAAFGGPEGFSKLQRQLESKGYATRNGTDENGRQTLEIHHLGDDAGLFTNLNELGLVKGGRKTIENAPQSLGSMLHTAWGGIQYATKDSARILSSIYLIGDIALTLAGAYENRKTAAAGKKGNIAIEAAREFFHNLTNFKGDDTLSTLSNSLVSLSGIFAIAQSLIFLEYARDGSELHLENLKKKMDISVRRGDDPLEALRTSLNGNGHDEAGMLSGMHKFLMRHPIEAGSVAQIMGQVALMSSAGIKLYRGAPTDVVRSDFTKGQAANIARGTLSIAGWLALMHPPKEVGEKSPWSSPHRIVEEFNQHPERFASGLNFGASAFGLWSSVKRNNPAQASAESIWLLGDIVMAFINKSHYGKDGEKMENMAGQAASQFLQDAPIAYSAAAGEELYKTLGRYIARRTVEMNMKEKPQGMDGKQFELEKEQSVNDISERITRGILKAMAGKPNRFSKIVHNAALVVDLFPEAQRETIRTGLAKAISDHPGVYADEQETAEAIQSAHERISRNSSAEKPTAIPGMATLAPSISDLLFALPGINLNRAANAVYDVITTVARTGPQDETILARTMNNEAAKTLGINPREVDAIQRQNQSTQITA